MTSLHEAIRRCFAALLGPVTSLPPLLGLTVVSALSGGLLLLGFRLTSRPATIRAAKRRMQANLLAVRLYRDDLGVVLRAQARTFAALGAYMGSMLVPFFALLLPFALLFAHLDARYAHRALRPGERAIVTTSVAEAADLGGLTLEGSSGVEVESRPVRIRSQRQASWRVRALEPGSHSVTLRGRRDPVDKQVVVAAAATGASRLRARPSLSSLFLAPTDPPIPTALGVESLEVSYPTLDLSLLGWRLHWIVVFLIVSAVVAFALRKRVGVEF